MKSALANALFLASCWTVCFALSCSGTDASPAAPDSGGSTLEEGCRTVSSVSVSSDEVLPMGFSASDALSSVKLVHHVPFQYANSGKVTSANLTVTPSTTSSPRLARVFCKGLESPSELQIDVEVSFSTADGEFASTENSVLEFGQLSSTGFFIKLSPFDCASYFDPGCVCDGQYASLFAHLTKVDVSGDIALYAGCPAGPGLVHPEEVQIGCFGGLVEDAGVSEN